MAEKLASPAEAGRRQRAAEALAKLDLDGKINLLAGETEWALPADDSIGLGRVVMSDGPAGVRGGRWSPGDTAVQMPNPTALAATWDPELARRAGRLLAQEARRKGVHVLLAPTVNMHRSPRAGRHFESYSEDPLLSGWIGAGFVLGVQDGGVAATVKHFVANDSESDRFTIDVRVDERTLRELYLAPFEHIVRTAGPWMVMSAYNKVNGVTMTEHGELNAVLRDEWGFDGALVSDWHAARDTVADARAGMDIAMPGPDTIYGDHLRAAVREGRVHESQVDRMAYRVLLLAARVGALDHVPADPVVGGVQDGHAIAHEVAARSAVLLRNHAPLGGSPPLPLNTKALRSLAVVGASAAAPRTGGGGSARVFPPYRVSVLQGLRDALGPEVDVVHAVGADPQTTLPTLPGEILGELYDAEGAVLGQAALPEASSYDLGTLLAGVEVEQVRVAELSGRLHVAEAGRHVFEVRGAGHFALVVNGSERFNGLLELDDPQAPGEIIFKPDRRRVEVDLEPGEVEFALIRSDVDPQNLEFALFALGYSEPLPDPEEQLAQAVHLAEAADAAIVVVGTSEDVESEGFDRTSLALPGRQDELVSRVAAANPSTVAVVNSGAPVLMPWREEVGAVLLGWFGGQEMGRALADVLIGREEPGGRLPTTWPACEEDVPVLSTRPEGDQLDYEEGVFIGHRAWRLADREPAYWFGHGLGYTTWRYESISVERGSGAELGRVRVRLTNAGGRWGREVVQVYLAVSAEDTGPARPRQWLAGSAVATAEPGATAEAHIAIPRRAAEVWDGGWHLAAGPYQVLAGASYADIRLAADMPLPKE